MFVMVTSDRLALLGCHSQVSDWLKRAIACDSSTGSWDAIEIPFLMCFGDDSVLYATVLG